MVFGQREPFLAPILRIKHVPSATMRTHSLAAEMLSPKAEQDKPGAMQAPHLAHWHNHESSPAGLCLTIGNCTYITITE